MSNHTATNNLGHTWISPGPLILLVQMVVLTPFILNRCRHFLQPRQLCYPMLRLRYHRQSCRSDPVWNLQQHPRRRRPLFRLLLQRQRPCWSCRGRNQPYDYDRFISHPSHSFEICDRNSSILPDVAPNHILP